MEHSKTDIVPTLYGSETYFYNCVCYCYYHHKYLTARQLKQKHCLGKQCKCMKRLDHPYWEHRERKKNRKHKNI